LIKFAEVFTAYAKALAVKAGCGAVGPATHDVARILEKSDSAIAESDFSGLARLKTDYVLCLYNRSYGE
jgi:hypothetical protein